MYAVGWDLVIFRPLPQMFPTYLKFVKLLLMKERVNDS